MNSSAQSLLTNKIDQRGSDYLETSSFGAASVSAALASTDSVHLQLLELLNLSQHGDLHLLPLLHQIDHFLQT